MSAILAKTGPDRDLLSVPIPGCVVRRQSLTILSEEGFHAAGRALAEFDECSQWLFGDYLLFAEQCNLRTVLESARANLHRSTIYSYIDTARFYPKEDRVPELCFNHHSSAMYILGKNGTLPAAKKWLARAKEKEWTVGELREAMRTAERKAEGDPGPMRGVVRITDFTKISKFCATVHPDELPQTEVDEIRRATAPLFQFLCEIHRPKFQVS